MALIDLFLSGVSSCLEPALWRTSSSTNKLRGNRCRNSRDRKCSQQCKSISAILRNLKNEKVFRNKASQKRSPSSSLLFSVLRMQRIRSKQQKYKYGHKISENSKESPAGGTTHFSCHCQTFNQCHLKSITYVRMQFLCKNLRYWFFSFYNTFYYFVLFKKMFIRSSRFTASSSSFLPVLLQSSCLCDLVFCPDSFHCIPSCSVHFFFTSVSQ